MRASSGLLGIAARAGRTFKNIASTGDDKWELWAWTNTNIYDQILQIATTTIIKSEDLILYSYLNFKSERYFELVRDD
jgi:hypothetical protein